MAKVFGVVASGLTIAQALGEILSGVREIHYFCSSVRNFPEKINSAVTELNLLCQVLWNLQENPKFRDAAVDSAILRYCHEIARDLESILSKIQKDCSTCKEKKKYWAPLKTYLRKDSMEDMYRRLERAKTMLNLVISSHILITQEKTTTVVPSIDSEATPRAPTVSASNDVKVEAVHESPSQVTKIYSTVANHWISSLLGVYSHHSRVTRAIHVKQGRALVTEGERVIKRVILPSAWLRLWGVSITCMRRNLGWEYLLSPIRVVSDSSPIFKACREGSIHEVSSLLNNSEATLQDTSEWGWSLLHIAAMHAQVELCRWLLQRGCNGNIVDVRNGWTPLLAISALSGRTIHSNLIKKRKELGILRAPEVEYPPSRIHDVMRVLVEEGAYDPLDLSKTGWSALHEYSGPAGPFRYLIEQQQTYLVDLKGLSTEQHNDLAWSLADQYWRSSAELLLVALTNGLTPNVVEPFQPAWNRYRSCTLLHIEAQRLDRYGFSGYSLEPSLQIMAKYISKGASLHSRDSFGATPLDDILSYKGHDRNDHKVMVLSQWMTLLHSHKIDLAEYFQEEERIHDSHCVIHVKYHRPMIERKFSVEYGNTGKKVTIKVVDVVQNYSKPLLLPGSWIEERGGFERDAFGRYVCKNTTPSAEYSVSFEI